MNYQDAKGPGNDFFTGVHAHGIGLAYFLGSQKELGPARLQGEDVVGKPASDLDRGVVLLEFSRHRSRQNPRNFRNILMNCPKMPSYEGRGPWRRFLAASPGASGSPAPFSRPGYGLLFRLFGIMLWTHKYESEVPVDPEGKFCYGRGIVAMIATNHCGIPSRRSAGALS